MHKPRIFSHYDGQTAHVYHVTDLALTLFDHVRQVYKMPEYARDVLEIGSFLHDVGITIDEKAHHTIGRDIVLDADIPGMDAKRRAMAALLVAFHRKRVRPEREPTYLFLSEKRRHVALQLAAILRVADGLDYCHTQSTRIETCEVGKKRITLFLSGTHLDEHRERAQKKADLWRDVFDHEIEIRDHDGSETEPPPIRDMEVVAERWQAIQHQTTDDSLSYITRKMLRRWFREMVAEEKDVREDKDIEAVHDMRVATRRMRALIPVLETVAPAKQIASFNQGLRKVARALGKVRDNDVFLEQIHNYTESAEEKDRDLSPLVNAITRDRDKARKRLLDELDSQRYEDFKRAFATFIVDEPTGWNTTLRMRDFVGSTVWRRYEVLRAYELHFDLSDLTERDAETLHEARIAGKYLRYVLELCTEWLGSRVDSALKPLMRLQECLGDLQDIEVEAGYINALKISKEQRAPVKTYLARREEERKNLLYKKFPHHWEAIAGSSYQQDLADLILSL